MRLRITLAGALAATLALTATAHAAGTITGGPAKAGGYDIFLHAVDGREDQLTITMDQGTPKRGQTDILTVTDGVDVTVRGGSASIRGSLGSRGRIDLRLRGASRQARKPRKGCTSTRATYEGELHGRLRLKLPNGRWVTIRSLRGSTTSGTIECQGIPGTGGDGEGGGDAGEGGEPQLMLTKDDGQASITFVATKTSLMLMRSTPERRERGATVTSTSMARAMGSRLLTVSGGGARAAVKSAGGFTGNGVFTRTEGAGAYATGPLGGSLRVTLTGTPAIHVAGDDAVLLNGDKG